MVVINEQQAASLELQLTMKILDMLKHSYLKNMASLNSAIGQEVRGTGEREGESTELLLSLLLRLVLLLLLLSPV